MKIFKFKPNEKIKCIYCSEKSEYKSKDYVPKDSFAHSEETCGHCDEKFLIRQSKNNLILVTSNLSDKPIYSIE